MIGTTIRSIRHLFRVSDTSFKPVLIKLRENSWDVGLVGKTPAKSSFGETVFLFNNLFKQSHWSYDTIISSEDFKKCFKVKEDLREHFSRIMSFNYSELSTFDGIFQEIVLLPESFNRDYEKFCKENQKMFYDFSVKYGFKERDIRAKRLYIYSDGSKNFFQWAVNAYFKNKIPLTVIKDIFVWNESYKQLAKNLSKGTITAYTSRDSIPVLLDELSELRKEKRINDSINSFNTMQKKMLKENELEENTKQALWRLSRLSETKRVNFIKKVSSIDDFKELCRQLKFVTSVHFSWSKESFMDFIDNVEEIKYEKIFENDNIVLVKVLDYETVKQLGKTTNWCISKNKSYWNNYVESYHGSATQYMIFDFSKLEDDKLSIIGFTTLKNKGITSAHNFINEPLMGEDEGEQVLLNSFIANFNEGKNIYSILAEDGIDITLVVHYDAPTYQWDKDSAINYLYECVNPENIEILCERNGKIAMRVMDSGIRYFFGDTYRDNISSDYYNSEHIIFFDFSKNRYDVNKLQYAIIEEGYGDEDYCIGVYNERSQNAHSNFDTKLIEFGLPYNTIRRTNNLSVRLKNAIGSYNMPMIENCLKECEGNETAFLKKVIKNEFGSDCLYDMIIRTVTSYVSFDYIGLLYDNGLNLTDFMSNSYVGDIINDLVGNVININRATRDFANFKPITNEDVDRFYEHKIARREDVKYVGFYLAIKMILEHECKNKFSDVNSLTKRFLCTLGSYNRNFEVFEQLLLIFRDKLILENGGDGIINLVRYGLNYGSDSLKDFIFQNANDSNPKFKGIVESIKSKSSSAFGTFTTATTAAYNTIDIDEIRNVFEYMPTH
jgi:hypothetical protein